MVTAAGLFGEFREFVQQAVGQRNEVVEIDQVVLQEVAFVLFVNLGDLLVVFELGLRVGLGRGDERILVTGYLAGDQRNRQIVVDLFENTFFVVGVDHHEVVLAPETVDMEFQKQQTELMKGTEQRRIALRRDHCQRAFAHLLGRLVGKRQRQRIARRDADHVQQVGQARCNRRRLTAACAGEDEQRPLRLSDRPCLYIIKVFKYMFHRPLLSCH